MNPIEEVARLKQLLRSVVGELVDLEKPYARLQKVRKELENELEVPGATEDIVVGRLLRRFHDDFMVMLEAWRASKPYSSGERTVYGIEDALEACAAYLVTGKWPADWPHEHLGLKK